jgi:hypothetical protein
LLIVRINRLNQLIENGTAVKGRWEFSPQNEVVYRSSEDGTGEVRVKAALVAAEAGTLVLGVTQRKTNRLVETSLLKLSGVWCSDLKNQLTFEVEKEFGRRDILTFRGVWKINETHDIVYTWQRTHLKTKIKEVSELVIKGYWDVTEKNRLTYYVGGDSAQAFKFRGSFQSHSLLAKSGEIRYQLGMEVRGRTRLQTLVFFGVWKFSRKLELFFEMEYAGGVRRKIVFGGAVLLRPDSKIEILLTAINGEPLGVELILNKDFFSGNAQLFVRLEKTAQESAAEAGLTLKW